MGLPTSKQVSNSEFTPIDAGVYTVTLKSIGLDIYKEYQSEGFNNGDGLRYQGCTLFWDVDGEEYREMFVKVSMNERAKFYNRMSALFGKDIGEDDDMQWTLDEKARQNAEYDNYFKASKNDDDGKYEAGDFVHKGHEHDGIVGLVKSLSVNETELIGKSCLLNLKLNAKGYNRADAGAASPLPKARKRPEGAPS